MHFRVKNTLKSNNNHTLKHPQATIIFLCTAINPMLYYWHFTL
jgi:hypothetical protein